MAETPLQPVEVSSWNESVTVMSRADVPVELIVRMQLDPLLHVEETNETYDLTRYGDGIIHKHIVTVRMQLPCFEILWNDGSRSQNRGGRYRCQHKDENGNWYWVGDGIW